MIREEMESTDFNKNKVWSLFDPTNQLYCIDDKIFGMWENGIDLYEILKSQNWYVQRDGISRAKKMKMKTLKTI